MAGPLGSTPGIIVGVGVGAAASAALEPAIELPRQTAWTRNPNKVLDPGIMARLAAQGGISLDAARASALREGFSADKLDALVYLAQTVPGVAEALTLWRRGLISDDLWLHTLVKGGLDTRYQAGLSGLKVGEPLDPAVVAVAVQRTLLPNPGILPNQPSTGGSNVPPMPQVARDPYAEAAKSGVPPDVLDVLARIVGLPASPDLAARMHFRNIITEGAFNQAILEGNTRGEWAPFLLDGFRQILTAGEYTELQLRGFYDRAARLANTQKHGMSDEDSDWLYDVLGRAIAVHQVTTGLARGGAYPGNYANVPEPYKSAIQRSNIREEWAELDYANRYTYPTGFMIKAEAKAGTLAPADTNALLLEVGWSPKWATFFSQAWAGGTGTTPAADPWVKRAQTQLWTATHRSYVNGDSTAAQVGAALTALGVTAAAQPAVLALWDAEAALTRKDLAASDIRKEYRGQLITQAQAIARLVQLGYSQTDATEYLLLQ